MYIEALIITLSVIYRLETRIDYCAEEQCQNGAQCVNNAMNFECICADGFSGRTCEIGMA